MPERNIFRGTIETITRGSVNAEVGLITEHGDHLVAVVSSSGARAMGLKVGRPAIGIFKAPSVILVDPDVDLIFSTRNHFHGTVTGLNRGVISTEVALQLPGGTIVTAVLANEAVDELGLTIGQPGAALVKDSHVVLGIPKT